MRGRIRNARKRGRESLLNLKEKVVLAIAVAAFSILAAWIIVPTWLGAHNLPAMFLGIASSLIAFSLFSSFVWGRERKTRGQA